MQDAISLGFDRCWLVISATLIITSVLSFYLFFRDLDRKKAGLFPNNKAFLSNAVRHIVLAIFDLFLASIFFSAYHHHTGKAAYSLAAFTFSQTLISWVIPAAAVLFHVLIIIRLFKARRRNKKDQ